MKKRGGAADHTVCRPLPAGYCYLRLGTVALGLLVRRIVGGLGAAYQRPELIHIRLKSLDRTQKSGHFSQTGIVGQSVRRSLDVVPDLLGHGCVGILNVGASVDHRLPIRLHINQGGLDGGDRIKVPATGA